MIRQRRAEIEAAAARQQAAPRTFITWEGDPAPPDARASDMLLTLAWAPEGAFPDYMVLQAADAADPAPAAPDELLEAFDASPPPPPVEPLPPSDGPSPDAWRARFRAPIDVPPGGLPW
jgi:hypothetical protein